DGRRYALLRQNARRLLLPEPRGRRSHALPDARRDIAARESAPTVEAREVQQVPRHKRGRVDVWGKMGWKQRGNRAYYYRSHRNGKRCTSEYIGAGVRAERAARFDTVARIEATVERDRRRALMDLASEPAELRAYTDAVRAAVADVLTALGFHRHKRQWR